MITANRNGANRTTELIQSLDSKRLFRIIFKLFFLFSTFDGLIIPNRPDLLYGTTEMMSYSNSIEEIDMCFLTQFHSVYFESDI